MPKLRRFDGVPAKGAQQVGETKKKTKKAPTTVAATPIFEPEETNGSNCNTVATELGPYDIVCGRNNGAYNYIGNRRFRLTIEMNLQRYLDCPTREDRTNVVKSIVTMLLEQSGARFLRKETIENDNSKLSGSMAGEQQPRQQRHSRYIVMTKKEACKKVYRSFCDLIAAPSRKGEQRGGTKMNSRPSATVPESKLPGRPFGQNEASKSWQDI